MPNHLSQIINSTSGFNFHDFITRYKVKEAQRRINSVEIQHTTLPGMGYLADSHPRVRLTAPHRAFKKHTGLTPIECRKTRSGYIDQHQLIWTQKSAFRR